MPERTASGKPVVDGTLLSRPLGEVSAGLPPGDPRLQDIVGLVVRGSYDAAAAGTESLWNSKIYDVRLVGYYLYGAFLEQGLPSLPTLMESVWQTLDTNWERIGPAERKADAGDVALQWLFKTLAKHIEFHHSRNDELWQGWCDAKNLPAVNDALDKVEPVRAALTKTLKGRTKALDRLSALEAWLQRLADILRAEVAEQAARAQQKAVPKELAEPTEVDATPAQTIEPVHTREVATRAEPLGSFATIEVSPPFKLLLRKLDAFQKLVDKGDFTRAAVAAADIQEALAHFDPRVYLPKLLSPFYAALAAHGEAIEAQLQASDSMTFRALADLFRVDVDEFSA